MTLTAGIQSISLCVQNRMTRKGFPPWFGRTYFLPKAKKKQKITEVLPFSSAYVKWIFLNGCTVRNVTIENQQSPFYVINRVTLTGKKLYQISY